MSENVPPSAPASAPPPPRQSSFLAGCLLPLSVGFNIVAGILLLLVCSGLYFKVGGFADSSDATALNETIHSGKATNTSKVAIITVEGPLVDGPLMRYPQKQIEQAAADKDVKAIVLRINSPGGSVTASEDLHQRLTKLRAGDEKKRHDKKPIVVSMGPLAASGGYYIAMPSEMIFAEKLTMTGSIGVFVSLPDLHKFDEKYGFTFRTFKAGEIKDSGSPFREMTEHEKEVWQDMVDSTYREFLNVVEAGRPQLKDKLLERFDVEPVQIEGTPAKKPYKRYRADGGIWTAEKALELKLIDRIGSLDDAVAEAAKAAKLDEDKYKTIRYQRMTPMWMDLLQAKSAVQTPGVLDPAAIRQGLSPRLWYLAPGHEMEGMMAVIESEAMSK